MEWILIILVGAILFAISDLNKKINALHELLEEWRSGWEDAHPGSDFDGIDFPSA
ncbi:MAG: hypothetical protein UX71_C0002G0134 [Parcubacteria group bacterium GW2011_GWA1_47_10]|nr:MAG: hypothetical protein UX71_C0002G0134 [Parcubacteria group bacterium GW2011_GWA1_47_10]